jgi:hypothetical protein
MVRNSPEMSRSLIESRRSRLEQAQALATRSERLSLLDDAPAAPGDEQAHLFDDFRPRWWAGPSGDASELRT